MIKVDYSLEIINEKKTYGPRKEFIEPLSNSKNQIFEITADNSYGKTFLLNLIAHSLSADKLGNNRILPSIKDAISRYNNSSQYNLSYNIDLKLPDESILHIQKDSNNEKIANKDDGPPIGHNQLHKELSIIYDVPINPSERLDAVIKDLSIWNDSITQKIKGISQNLNNITKDFDIIKDEKKIKTLEKEIEELKNTIYDLKTTSDSLEKTKEKLSTYADLKKLIDLKKNKENLELEISKNKTFLKKIPKPSSTSKKDDSKIKEYNLELSQLDREVKEIISTFIKLINEDSELKDFLFNKQSNKVSYENIFQIDSIDLLVKEDILDDFYKNIENLKDEILRYIETQKNDDSYAIKDMYSSLIEILDRIVERNIDFHLYEITSINTSNIKEDLKKIINDYNIKDYSVFTKFFKSDLKKIKEKCALYIRTNSRLENENQKKSTNPKDSKYYKIKGHIDSAEEKIQKIKNQKSIIQARCINDLNIKDVEKFENKINDYLFHVKSEVGDKEYLNNVKDSIQLITKKIIENNKVIEENNKKVGVATASLEIEKNKKTSIYTEKQKKKINDFKNLLIIIGRNLDAYKLIINQIENKTFDKFSDESDREYVKLAGKIIANSMDNKLLRTNGEFIKLNYYDMILKQFHCDENIIINKDDVSTGLASANYLKQKIDNVEGKYVVVLLDEIGNMAQGALNKVIESIKKLQDEKRLVLALLTSPSSKGIKINEY